MNLRRRSWSTRGKLYLFRELIDWGLLGRRRFRLNVGTKPTPEVIAAAAAPVVMPTRLRKPQKISDQMGFGF